MKTTKVNAGNADGDLPWDIVAEWFGIQAPWEIVRMESDDDRKRVDVWVDYGKDVPLRCPICGAIVPGYDHAPERVWRHLDICEHRLFIHASLPRCRCKEHGVKTLRAPWEGGAKHLTRLFSCHAARAIRAAQSLSAARELLRISPWQLQAIREWAVEYGLRHRSQDEEHVLLGIDEKSFGKRQNFVTIVYSHTKRCVIDIVPGRSAEAAACALRQAIPEKQRASVKGVSMDFSTAYAKAVAEVLPDARQVVDKFHAMALLSKAVDEIRRAVVRSPQCPDVLKNTRHLWLKDRCHLTEKEIARFDALMELDHPLVEAWNVKYAFRFLYDRVSAEEAKKFFWVWFSWAAKTRLRPLLRVAKTFLRNHDRLANALRFGGLSNALAEGINSKIQLLKVSARGFRNFANYRIAILFHCGALPHPTH